jgi:glycosyltransferase involved in cell wall biosynthesis
MEIFNSLVSVILPVYNGGKYISEAIDSILNQKVGNVEIIIIDDGSTDNSGEIALRYKEESEFGSIRYIKQSNQGPSAARNLGIREAGGEFIAFIDSDDIWSSNKLSLQLSILHNNPEVVFAWGCLQMFSIDSQLESYFSQPTREPNLGTLLVRRYAFDKVGLFDKGMMWGEDHDWFIRAREKLLLHLSHNETVLFYRKHKANSWLGRKNSEKAIFHVIKRHLDRNIDDSNKNG